MKRLLFIMAAGIVLLATTLFSQTLNFPVAGQTRNCVIHVPEGINNPAVVFFLHGAGGSGAGFQNDTKGNTTADREKFIAAYPSGINGNWNYNDGSNDFTFMLALIDTLNTRYSIDTNRVYVTGFSMGGGMTFALACRYSTVFAAAAPVSAAGTTCSPERKIPLFLTFGTKDMYPPANYMQAIDRWVGINGCPLTPVVTRPYPSTNPQSVVTRLIYGPCDEQTYVVADSVHDGGHGWPTDTRTSVNQADEVWEFFKQFSLGGSTATYRRNDAAVRSTPASIMYFQGMLQFHGVKEPVRVSVIDTKGRLVARTETNHYFVLSDIPGGVYIVCLQGKGVAADPFKMVIP